MLPARDPASQRAALKARVALRRPAVLVPEVPVAPSHHLSR
jgi:hypothetical protein